MKIIGIRAKNIFAFEDLDFDFRVRLCLLTGRNGAGKTNLFRSMVWGLFGEGPERERGGSIVRRGAAFGETEVDLVSDTGETFTVTRKQRKDRRDQAVLNAAGEVLHHDDAGVTGWVNEALGLDREAFCSCCLYSSTSSRFADPKTTDAARKDIIRALVGSVDCGPAEKRARARVATLKAKISEITTKRAGDARAAETEEARAKSLDAAHERWRLDRDARVEKHREAAAARRAVVGVVLDDFFDAKRPEHIAKATADLAAWSAVVDLEALKAARDALAIARDVAATAKADARAAKNALEEAHMHAAEGECAVCGSDLATAPRTTELGAAIPGLTRELADTQARITEANDAVTGYAAEVEAQETRARSRKALVDELAALKAAAAAADTRAKERATAEERAAEADALADAAMAEKSELGTQADAARKEAAKLRKRDAAWSSGITKLEHARAHAEFWVRGFGAEGIPAFLVDEALPFVENTANGYLEVLSDGALRVRYAPASTTKDGSHRDRIGVSWTVEGTDDIPLSKGQKQKIDIATTLALMALARSHRSSVPSLLLVDEAMDGLDAESRLRTAKLLRLLRKEIDDIIVVSHDAIVSSMFDHSFVIEKTEGEPSRVVAA